MDDGLEVKPLPQHERRNFFLLLLGLFVLTLPFLFLYATGYRFDLGKKDPFISTGGLYVAAERGGAEIYIDDELVRETRTFRKAFYAQGLEPGTHRIHVQKPGHHTWVKELPVYEHIVTEAQAFNMPLVPQVRILSPWKNSSGETVIFKAPRLQASSTNAVLVATSTVTKSFIPDTEYATLVQSFQESASGDTGTAPSLENQIQTLFTATSTDTAADAATTTKIFNGVRLFEKDGEVFASFVGSREQMPYYYCAKDFEFSENPFTDQSDTEEDEVLMGPVQYVPKDAVCNPIIQIDRKDEAVRSFEFYPGSFDLVLMTLQSGIYVVEIDDRSWQNMQPLIMGEDLALRILNGSIYVFDGTLIYQILTDN